MSKNVNKKVDIHILKGTILLVLIVAMLVVSIRKNVPQSGEISNPMFIDENGEAYVAGYLKEMTESSITVDVIEFITDDNEEMIKNWI